MSLLSFEEYESLQFEKPAHQSFGKDHLLFKDGHGLSNKCTGCTSCVYSPIERQALYQNYLNYHNGEIRTERTKTDQPDAKRRKNT